MFYRQRKGVSRQMIKIQGLSKKFNDNVVLDNIDITIEKGDVVALIGSSGTGKSTLLRCLNLLEKPEQGTITFDDFSVDLANCKSKERLTLCRRTAMVFQQFNLFKRKTALQNVTEALTCVKKMKKEEAQKFALVELEKVGMLDRIGHYPKHLSGGQQQRVAIARALALEPDLLLMDEPTSALDPELVGEVLDTIRLIAKEGNTLLLASHEMNFVKNVATKVIFLENGHIVEQGTPEDVFENPQNERTKRFLANNNMLQGSEYFI